MNFAGEAALPSPAVIAGTTRRSESGTRSGFSSTVLTIEKIAVFAPIPSASPATAVMVKPGLLRNMRIECFTSAEKASIRELLMLSVMFIITNTTFGV